MIDGPWSVTITGPDWDKLHGHLFPGDGDEHGAVLRCGVARTLRGTRLLVHDVVLAKDSVDYVPGVRGYRRLTPEFVRDTAHSCADDSLVCLAVHCHGGSDRVGFSSTDLASHERGYPALLDFTSLPAIGALVFAEGAVAGDIWTQDRNRHSIDHLRILGRPQIELRPAPLRPIHADPTYDRQARIFGDRGQAILGSRKVAIIGLGGAGSLICEYLARLGVGELVLIDPDRVETSNLSRIVGSRRRDAWPWFTDQKRPEWVQHIGRRLTLHKVRVAARVVKQASSRTPMTLVPKDVTEPDVAALLKDCDHIFLAADSALARRLVDAITHQYLIPSTQVGAKVSVSTKTGAITDIFSVSRMSTPGSGCLRCNFLVSPARLADEAKSAGERRRQRYVNDEDVHDPSVITLNAVAASRAVDDWLMAITGLVDAGSDPDRWVSYHPMRDELTEHLPRKDPACTSCGPTRFALGDAVALPTKLR